MDVFVSHAAHPSQRAGYMSTTSSTRSAGTSSRREPLCPFCAPRLRFFDFLRRFAAPWPGPSLDGGRFELLELRARSSACFWTSAVRASILSISVAITASRFASSARSSSISDDSDTTKVDHVKDLLSIPKSEPRGMITHSHPVNGCPWRPRSVLPQDSPKTPPHSPLIRQAVASATTPAQDEALAASSGAVWMSASNTSNWLLATSSSCRARATAPTSAAFEGQHPEVASRLRTCGQS